MSQKPTRLHLESLEDRNMPSVFTVTNANDSGPGSLRAELALAAADGQPDTIQFAANLAHAVIPLSTIGDESVGPSAFLVQTPVTIEGSGQTLTRSASAPAMRFFTVSNAGNLTLENLRIRNGIAAGEDGVQGQGTPG